MQGRLSVVRKFRLTTTSRVRASTYAWGPCSTGDADKACKKTRKQTKLKLSDLTSLNLTFFSAHENNQSKLSGYLSAAVPCCCLSLLFVDVHRAGASNSESKVIQVPVKNRPCNCCWKTNFTSSTNMPFQSLTCSKNVKPVPQNFTSTKLLK